MDSLLTYREAAALLNIKVNTVYGLVRENRIPHVRLGRRLVRFSREALENWLREHAVTPGGSR